MNVTRNMNLNSLLSDIRQCCCIPATSEEIMDTINQVEEVLAPDIPEPEEPEYADPYSGDFLGIKQESNVSDVSPEGKIAYMQIYTASPDDIVRYSLEYDESVLSFVGSDGGPIPDVKKEGTYTDFSKIFYALGYNQSLGYGYSADIKIEPNPTQDNRLIDLVIKIVYKGSDGREYLTRTTNHYIQKGENNTPLGQGTPQIYLSLNKNGEGEFVMNIPAIEYYDNGNPMSIVRNHLYVDVTPHYIDGQLIFQPVDSSQSWLNSWCKENSCNPDRYKGFPPYSDLTGAAGGSFDPNPSNSPRSGKVRAIYTYDKGKTVEAIINITQAGRP